jgi:hypothetical protein
VMEFLCPNGHRIRCQPEQAGRAAKCPRCGVKFRIPKPTDLDVSETTTSDSNFSRPEFIDSTGSSRRLPASASAHTKEPEIEFLCPNGHRLHGPESLQGRPGQCPECGSRFRIPTYEDVSAEEATEQEISLGRADGTEGSDAGKRSEASAQVVADKDRVASGRPSPTGQAMAELVARLWQTRPAGSTVELRLRDGTTIAFDQFLEKASQQSGQGVLVVKDADGSLSLVAVAWDAVAQASLRGIAELPKEWAE